MHRDQAPYDSRSSRGVSSKQFVAELHEQGIPREEAIEAVRRLFVVPRGAASLFVRSHPAWADEGRLWEC